MEYLVPFYISCDKLLEFLQIVALKRIEIGIERKYSSS